MLHSSLCPCRVSGFPMVVVVPSNARGHHSLPVALQAAPRHHARGPLSTVLRGEEEDVVKGINRSSRFTVPVRFLPPPSQTSLGYPYTSAQLACSSTSSIKLSVC